MERSDNPDPLGVQGRLHFNGKKHKRKAEMVRKEGSKIEEVLKNKKPGISYPAFFMKAL